MAGIEIVQHDLTNLGVWGSCQPASGAGNDMIFGRLRTPGTLGADWVRGAESCQTE